MSAWQQALILSFVMIEEYERNETINNMMKVAAMVPPELH